MKVELFTRSDLRSQRKCKIVSVHEHLLLDILSNGEAGNVFTWATAGDLPADVVLLGIWHNVNFGAWEMLIGSAFFPPCPAGGEYERIPLDANSIRYRPISDVMEVMIHRGDESRYRELPARDLRESNLKPIAHFRELQPEETWRDREPLL